jgi:Asp-tRNA(Asn)/Glu-tRNA(Gln) amidotransferase A subunit family amidase
MQPFRMSALELISAYRTRKLSPVEAMASVIERVEAFEPHIHATWLYAPERALKEARASEARWAKGRSTACRSRSRTISPPAATRRRSAPRRAI